MNIPPLRSQFTAGDTIRTKKLMSNAPLTGIRLISPQKYYRAADNRGGVEELRVQSAA